MIILEGCDGAGKTTLGKMLMQDGIVHTVLPSPGRGMKADESIVDRTFSTLRSNCTMQRVAVDRFLFSELVYGPIIRGTCSFTPRDTSEILSYLVNSGSYVILCFPRSVHSIVYKDDDPVEVRRNIESIDHEYRLWFSILSNIFPPGHVIWYCWQESERYRAIKETLKEKFGEHKRR